MPDSAAPQPAAPARRPAQAVAPPAQEGLEELALPYGASAATILRLQRSVGNRAVIALLARRPAVPASPALQRSPAAAPPGGDERKDEAAPALERDEARSERVEPGAGEPRTLGDSAPVQRAGGVYSPKQQMMMASQTARARGEQAGPEMKAAKKAAEQGGKPGAAAVLAQLAAAPAPPQAAAAPQEVKLPTMGPADGTPMQSTADLDEIYKQAEAAKGAYFGTVNAIAGSTGGRPMLADLKGRDSAKQKIDAEYNGDASRIVDILRATIAYDSVDGLLMGATMVPKQFKVVRAKDRFAKPVPGGYRDVMLNVATANGHVAELQLHLEALLAAKQGKGVGEGKGHKLYEETREITRLAATENRPLTKEELAKIQALQAESQELYDAALAKAFA